MSTADMTFMFQGVRKAAGAAAAALRVVLLPGESLRLPRACAAIRVLAGSAWITEDGNDFVLEAGARYRPRHRRPAPVVTAVGAEPLLFEGG
jgi:hypothetical protein